MKPTRIAVNVIGIVYFVLNHHQSAHNAIPLPYFSISIITTATIIVPQVPLMLRLSVSLVVNIAKNVNLAQFALLAKIAIITIMGTAMNRALVQ